MPNPKKWVHKTLMVTSEIMSFLNEKPGKRAKELLREAIERGVSPSKAPVGSYKLPIRFSAEKFQLVKDMKPAKMSGLILTLIRTKQQSKTQKKKYSTDKLSFHFGRVLRPTQEQMIPEALRALANGKIIAIEASTGSGKGTALLGAAVLDGRPALVAAPTIKIVRQLISEYKKISVPHDFSVVMGKQSFVSETLLKQYKDDLSLEQWAEIERWIQSPITDVTETPWLVESMVSFCKTIPEAFAQQCSLMHLHTVNGEDDKDDRGMLAWRDSLRRAHGNSKIIFCTHAMLAVDILWRLCETKMDETQRNLFDQQLNEAVEIYRTIYSGGISEAKKKNLEMSRIFQNVANERGEKSTGMFGHRVLYIDEAHSLEQSIANFFSNSLSLSSALSIVKKANLDNSKMKKIFDELVENGETLESVSDMAVTDHSDMHKLLIQFKKALSVCVNKTKKNNSPEYTKLLNLRKSVDKAMDGNGNHVIYINFSGSYKYPRIISGRKNLGLELGILWGSVPAAFLVSATLSAPLRGYEYVKDTLFLPEKRSVMGKKAEAPWLRSNVTVHTPSPSGSWLCRPKEEDPIDRWIGQIADVIDRVAKSAVGGTLVLCTSYEIIKLISNMVSTTTYRQLIIQNGTSSFEANEQLFRTRKRPIWLATGKAWIGLDLCSDTNDQLLTDLVGKFSIS